MNKRIPAITQQQVAAFFSPRPRDSHKGLFGTVVVIGGASGMVGAPLLAARAALKLGAGCVHVGLLADDAPVVDIVQPELMMHSAHDALKRLPHPQSLSPREREAEPSPASGITSDLAGVVSQPSRMASSSIRGQGEGNVLAVGCGMGTSSSAQKILYQALQTDAALVLDADALNLLARHTDLQEDLCARKSPSIITPHPGEAARLLSLSTAQVQAARAGSAQQLAEKFHCTAVLKGAESVCITRDGEIYLNKTGNPGMSAPGMGDVLAGMIAAFIAQGLDADRAMMLAVHLHGAAGDALAQQGITIGMTATDVTEWARWLLNQWVK